MSHGHHGTCQEAQDDIAILLGFVTEIARSETVAECDRVAARRCLASIGVKQAPKPPSADCAYCGQPKNSISCQTSHS